MRFAADGPGLRASHFFTDLAVIDVTPAGLVLREIARGQNTDDILAVTGAPLTIPPGDLPIF